MSFELRPILWTAKNLLAIWLITLTSSPALAQGVDSPPEITSSVYCDLHRELPHQTEVAPRESASIQSVPFKSAPLKSAPLKLASATTFGTTSNLSQTPTDTISSEQFANSDTTLSTPTNLKLAYPEPTRAVPNSKSERIPISQGDEGSQISESNLNSNSNSNSDSNSMEPINLAQSVPTDVTNENQQVDLVPTNIPRRTPAFNNFNNANMHLLYRLPSKMFFSSVIENSLRLETNVFQTSPKESSDMIYRIFPNTTVGYEIAKNTQIYSNYFFLRDQYTSFSPLLNRNFHSIGFGINRNVNLPKNRGTLILGLQGRGLFATLDKFPGSFFNDYLPSITYQKGFANGQVIFASVFGQLRFREMTARFQEGDIFYTLGHIYRRGGWALLNNFTLASNFGSQKIRQGPDTQIIILEHELSRQVSRKFPWLQTFIRAQEIFNMGAGNVPFVPGALGASGYPGFTGVNCRVFAGIRTTFFKPVIETPKLKGR